MFQSSLTLLLLSLEYSLTVIIEERKGILEHIPWTNVPQYITKNIFFFF